MLFRTLLASLLAAVVTASREPPSASRVIRFIDQHGNIRTGSPIKSNEGLRAQIIEGADAFGSLELTNDIAEVKTLLAPVPQVVPCLFLCVRWSIVEILAHAFISCLLSRPWCLGSG